MKTTIRRAFPSVLDDSVLQVVEWLEAIWPFPESQVIIETHTPLFMEAAYRFVLTYGGGHKMPVMLAISPSAPEGIVYSTARSGMELARVFAGAVKERRDDWVVQYRRLMPKWYDLPLAFGVAVHSDGNTHTVAILLEPQPRWE